MSGQPESARLSMRVSERVAETWYGAGRPGDDPIAVGVVAALTLLDRGDPDGPDPAKVIQAATDEHLVQMLTETWSLFWIRRPELAFRCGPFADWLNQDPIERDIARAAAAVARAAVKAGLWRITGEDVIGTLWTTGMRSNKARQARGEYYTPPALTQLMGSMLLGRHAEPGQSICDPCGTGGMFLGAALALLADGRDPADFVWVGADISAVSVAGLAVNAHAWDLGPNVVIGVANTLAEPDWAERALAEQRAVIEHRDRLMTDASWIAALHMVQALTAPEDASGVGTDPGPVPEAPVALAAAAVSPGGGQGDLLGVWCARCGTSKHPPEFCPRDDTSGPSKQRAGGRTRASRSPATTPPEDQDALF